ncbi:MAG TPA: cytochrome c biogenesis protein CcdA [Chitinophagaceae bacterium]|nr:cytochrome c biogenesis protein CcdA [Chitinophagaceae bacterium]
MRVIVTRFFCCLLIFISIASFSQDSAVYKWNYKSQRTSEGKYELIFSTNGITGWQLYAPGQELGGVKTVELKFADSSISVEKGFSTTGESKSFSSSFFENTTVKVYEGLTEWKIPISISGKVPAKLQGKLSYFYGNNEAFNSEFLDFNVEMEGGVETTTIIKIPSIDIKNPTSPCGDDGTSDKSIFTIFLLGLVGGLIALLTPCVFPMIPVTVSYFTNKSHNKKRGKTNAILYGLFIFLIYVLITIPFHLANDTISPEIFNNISTNIWLNLLFFVVFVVFAISFFGFFEIGLPSSIANKAHSKSGHGNIGGIFFMAGTLAIVSFSCTGPILGTLLVGVADQGAWPLTAGAAGFGIALGFPFALFAMFPNWLKSLPKSGGWMTNVKVVLGFIELALAVKFLSNADLVKQWGLLKREIFIGLWVIISFLTVLYLLGKIKFPHTGTIKKVSFTRIFFIFFFAAIGIYLIPGLTNSKSANLTLISGFPPPLCYSVYKHPVNCAEKYEPIKDYNRALERAKNENKPVLIDFTGWACVNCRRMEEKVWTNRIVDSLMRNEFVVVSLYVDERRQLPLTEHTVYKTSTGQEKSIITVGDKWATFQTENFGATSQPQYAIISADQIALTKTKYYTPDADKFIEWLQCGIETYKKNKK